MLVQEAGRVDTGVGHRVELLELERELRSKNHAVAASRLHQPASASLPHTILLDATSAEDPLHVQKRHDATLTGWRESMAARARSRCCISTSNCGQSWSHSSRIAFTGARSRT